MITTAMDDKTRFWNERYLTGIPPWDRQAVSPALHDWLTAGVLVPGRVLVPGCGRGHEVVALARAGFTVTALDIAPQALAHMGYELAQAGLEARLIRADVLHWRDGEAFDAIYEQTCLCALPPDDWPAYESRLHEWLKPGGRLCALFMQTGRPGGPPWHCALADMAALFPAARWQWPAQGEHPQVPHHHGDQYELAVVLTRR